MTSAPKYTFPTRTITVKQYRIECVSCRGSGQSQRPAYGTARFEQCKGCAGTGAVTVTETTTTIT